MPVASGWQAHATRTQQCTCIKMDRRTHQSRELSLRGDYSVHQLFNAPHERRANRSQAGMCVAAILRRICSPAVIGG
jgi:hypothetical protein